MSISTGSNQTNENEGQSRSAIVLENEILLMKLNAEFGAQIFLPEERVDPEIENHFLRSVYDFEKNVAEGRERSTIFRIIGEPVLPDESILNHEQVAKELEDVLDLLYKHRIELETIVNYPEREIYRFITKEFLQMEIDQPATSDCYLHFCYEDFYPNHEYDLALATKYFFNLIINDLSFGPQSGLYSRVRTSSGILIGYKEAISVIRASCSEFTSMQLHEHNINDIVVIDDMAFVYFDVRYGGFLPDGGQLEVKGEGELEFVYSDDTWWISFLRFPGIVI